MERKGLYRPGTIVTLKDGNIYRTTRTEGNACRECARFYGGIHNSPCYKQALIKFAFPPIAANMSICYDMYGQFMYPKLIKNEKSI